MLSLQVLVVIAPLFGCALGDIVDWVDLDYVIQQSQAPSAITANSRDEIQRSAVSRSKKGPWTVMNKNGVLPPSGDVRDYLSWAPYHWPDCRWCPDARTHLAHTEPEDPSSDPAEYSDSVNRNGTQNSRRASEHLSCNRRSRHNRAFKLRRSTSSASSSPTVAPLELSKRQQFPVIGLPSFATTQPAGATTTPAPVYGTPPPNQAAAKTTRASCTPSPTTSMAPSATWTTCPYVVRDGKANPDVRTLTGVDSVNSMSQVVLYNAVAYALQRSAVYSGNVARFVDAFFLDPSTGMKPNLNFGQVVRGPGKAGQTGTFTGILDFRVMVKVVNALFLMRALPNADWTAQRQQAMKTWMEQYAAWITGSSIGKITATKANNHVTFYAAQVAATKMFAQDRAGASMALENYFKNQFLDQLAASGEQPFEAVRTRPFHYRCFGIEAMITNAKLGDQLGLDFWTARSKYGATIQAAVDYTMSVDAGKEDVQELAPHVAATAAAYGDPDGRYAAFLQRVMPDYQSQPFWFYDQTAAMPRSPAAQPSRRRRRQLTAPGSADVQFECPRVFDLAPETELDNGIFVTCEDLRPFYNVTAPALR